MLVLLFALVDPIAWGDTIKPWDGASASITVFGQTSSQAGSTASERQSTVYKDHYQGFSSNNLKYHDINVYGSASADATSKADDLLHVGGDYNAGYPGILGPGASVVPPISATASWSGDQVMVTPPIGGTTPDSVRLQFALTFLAPQGDSLAVWQFGSMRVDANGQVFTIAATGTSDYSSVAPVSGNFDKLTPLPVSTAIPLEYLGTFHIDVSLNKSGTSDPFSLSLSSLPNTGLYYGGGFYAAQSACLALTGVTLPDGTSLADAGYGVSFASGLTGGPIPVPEPTSLASWTLAGLGASWLIRRRASWRAIV